MLELAEPTTDLESIAHLDFEPRLGDVCDGWRSSSKFTGEVYNEIKCDNPVAFYAFRSCCGAIDSLCVRCYNQHINGTRESLVKNDHTPACKFCQQRRPVKPYSHIEPVRS